MRDNLVKDSEFAGRALDPEHVVQRLDRAVNAARQDDLSSKVLLEFEIAEALLKMVSNSKLK